MIVAAERRQATRTTGRDVLDVSLDDAELRQELELTAHLIIAATASTGALPQDEVDRLLGL